MSRQASRQRLIRDPCAFLVTFHVRPAVCLSVFYRIAFLLSGRPFHFNHRSDWSIVYLRTGDWLSERWSSPDLTQPELRSQPVGAIANSKRGSGSKGKQKRSVMHQNLHFVSYKYLQDLFAWMLSENAIDQEELTASLWTTHRDNICFGERKTRYEIFDLSWWLNK